MWLKIISKKRYTDLLSNEDYLKKDDETIQMLNNELDLLKPNNDFYNKILELILNNPQYKIYKVSNIISSDKNDSINTNSHATFIVMKNDLISIDKNVITKSENKEITLGSLYFYALSQETTKYNERIRFNEFNTYPFLDADFSLKNNTLTVFINNLHSRCSNNNDFRRKGYGTLLFNSLLEILELNPLYSFLDISIIIEGELFEKDIECDKDIEIRNRFYKNKGFKLDTTEDEKNGKFEANFLDLIKIKRKHT